jgi:hypothetical protein
MKMFQPKRMKCACNRWGPGTTCERPTNTQNAKDLQDKLAKMRSERTEQDKIWDDSASNEIKEDKLAAAQTTKKILEVRDKLYSS